MGADAQDMFFKQAGSKKGKLVSDLNGCLTHHAIDRCKNVKVKCVARDCTNTACLKIQHTSPFICGHGAVMQLQQEQFVSE